MTPRSLHEALRCSPFERVLYAVEEAARQLGPEMYAQLRAFLDLLRDPVVTQLITEVSGAFVALYAVGLATGVSEAVTVAALGALSVLGNIAGSAALTAASADLCSGLYQAWTSEELAQLEAAIQKCRRGLALGGTLVIPFLLRGMGKHLRTISNQLHRDPSGAPRSPVGDSPGSACFPAPGDPSSASNAPRLAASGGPPSLGAGNGVPSAETSGNLPMVRPIAGLPATQTGGHLPALRPKATLPAPREGGLSPREAAAVAQRADEVITQAETMGIRVAPLIARTREVGYRDFPVRLAEPARTVTCEDGTIRMIEEVGQYQAQWDFSGSPGHPLTFKHAMMVYGNDKLTNLATGKNIRSWFTFQALDLVMMLFEVPTPTKKAQAVQDRLFGFLFNDPDRINYVAFRARGYQIGSGAMESMHRTGSQLRLKLPGAKWLEHTSQSIFNIRMMRLAGNSEHFWRQPDLEARY